MCSFPLYSMFNTPTYSMLNWDTIVNYFLNSSKVLADPNWITEPYLQSIYKCSLTFPSSALRIALGSFRFGLCTAAAESFLHFRNLISTTHFFLHNKHFTFTTSLEWILSFLSYHLNLKNVQKKCILVNYSLSNLYFTASPGTECDGKGWKTYVHTSDWN